MVKYRINNNIRKFRFFRDEMTQQKLADKVGVTRQTIIAIEQGKYSHPWNWHFVLHWLLRFHWMRCSLTIRKLSPAERSKSQNFRSV